jgi:transcription elongation GreA/GreB family factor
MINKREIVRKLKKNRMLVLIISVIVISGVYYGIQKAIDSYNFNSNSEFINEESAKDEEESAGVKVPEDEVDLDKINIGCKVKVLDMEFNEECEYKIVGSTEANSLKGKISNESPVGKALIGHKVGDTVEVETQAGVFAYKILEIQRSN